MANGPIAPSRETQVSTQINNVIQELDSIESNVDRAYGKFGSVINLGPPTVTAARPPDEALVDLADRIRSIRNRLSNINERLVLLSDSCEL